MAWTAPRTWTIGQLVTADALNVDLRDNLNHLKLAVGDDGRIPAISSTYFANLSGTNLTGIVKTAAANDFTAGNQNFNASPGNARLIVPVGADKWGV
jgi:hypothetical protein